MVYILALAALNLLSLVVFGWDKLCATQERRRIPEKALLQLALLGGWPALKLGQKLFHHKTRKQPFGWQLNTMAALNILGSLALYGAIAHAPFSIG